MCEVKNRVQFLNTINAVIRVTYDCNLRCKYCFLQHDGYDNHVLSEKVLERFCNITFPHYKIINLTWLGGEVTVIGLEKFSRFIGIVEEKAQFYGTKITNTIQSNASLLTRKFIEFLQSHDISIGLSFDGLYNGILRGNTKHFFETKKCLDELHIPVYVINVVSGVNVDDLIENYNYLKDNGINVSLSPYMDVNSPCKELNMTLNQYVDAMCNLFDYWIKDSKCTIKLDPFELMIRSYLRGRTLKCHPTCLKKWVGLAPDGTILPCGKEFPADYHYGNVGNIDDIRDMYQSEGFMNLARATLVRRKKCRKECDIFDYCYGGCSLSALMSGNIENNDYFLCKAYRNIFKYIIEKINGNDKILLKENIVNPKLHNLIDLVHKTSV